MLGEQHNYHLHVVSIHLQQFDIATKLTEALATPWLD